MKNWKYIGVAFLLLCLMGYVIFVAVKFSNKNDNQECNGVIIRIIDAEQQQFVTADDIEKILAKNRISFQKKTMDQINCKEIENCIKINPAVKKVHCYKTPSGGVRIDVSQRTPIMRIMGKTSYYVDDQKEIMPVSLNFTAYVPIITGNVSKKMATEEICEFVIFLQNDKFWNAQIEQIHVGENAEIVLIPRVGDHEIILGKLDGFETKMEKLKRFYNEGLSKIGWGDYKTINLKFENRVVCKKK